MLLALYVVSSEIVILPCLKAADMPQRSWPDMTPALPPLINIHNVCHDHTRAVAPPTNSRPSKKPPISPLPSRGAAAPGHRMSAARAWGGGGAATHWRNHRQGHALSLSDSLGCEPRRQPSCSRTSRSPPLPASPHSVVPGPASNLVTTCSAHMLGHRCWER